MREMLEQVVQGSVICFAPESMARYYARPDLSWVPLTDVEPLRVVLAGAAGRLSMKELTENTAFPAPGGP